MSPSEAQELKSQLTQYPRFIEFGCGGSTLFALDKSSAKVLSVDSDLKWLDLVAQSAEPYRSRLTLYFADLGKTRQWGHPVKPVSAEAAKRYHEIPWQLIDASQPSLCLIDGRFRLACALQAMVRLAPGSTILFHDFIGRSHFENYRNILGCFNAIDTMAIIKVQNDHNIRLLQDALGKVYCMPN